MVEPGQGSGHERVPCTHGVYDRHEKRRLGRPCTRAERDGAVDSKSHYDDARPQPPPALGDLLNGASRIEPLQVRPAHLDQVRHADPPVETATVPVCVRDQLCPDVWVKRDEPGTML